MKPLTFSGIDLGLERVGMTCVAQMDLPLTSIESFAGIGGFSSPAITPIALIEKEPTCCAVLRRHHPHALILEDVRDAGAHNLPWANIHKFGFPCQDLSVAGKRAGLAGGRSGLFFEAARITYELQPDYAIWENVPGLRTSCSCRRCRRHCNACGEIAGADETECLVCGSDELRGRVLRSHRGADFFTVISTLGYIGYFGCWTLFDAQYFGVAQRRQRLFGVFARHDLGVERCAKILSLATRLRGGFAPSSEARPDVAATIRTSSSGDGVTGTLGTAAGRNRGNVAAALNAHGGARRMDFESENFVVGTLQSHAKAHGHAMTTQQAAENGHLIVASTLNSAGNRGGFRTEPGEHVVAVSFTQNQRGELRTSDISSQLTTGGGKPGEGYAAALTQSGVRRLTPTECERLQGFDDGHTAWGIDEQGQRVEMADSVRYRMCGNAVCKNVSAWIDQQILRYGYAKD